MKAIRFTHYGSPDVLQLVEVEKPVPADDQVLLNVQAASANPVDWHLMRGAPFLARLQGGLLGPANPKLGVDVAGRVEAVGQKVTQFKPGDEVYGTARGSFAEYVCAAESRLALKPAHLSFEAAAAVPVAAITALQGLRDTGKIQAGQRVLVNGAAGGVGTFAVQIAKVYGARVTGVCSTRNLDLVRSIGAEQAIDYTREDFSRNGQRYDLIFDAVGNRSVADYQRALSPRGRCVIAGFGGLGRLLEHAALGRWASRTGGRFIGFMGMAAINTPDLTVLNEWLEAGSVAPVIERCWPLAETAAALRHLETGHARGKVVIALAQRRAGP
jgi:NADPH:quinone reductase-like Zn-dependent oxidoreductase